VRVWARFAGAALRRLTVNSPSKSVPDRILIVRSSTSDSLSDDEKRQVVVRFRDLQHAIATNAADVHARYEAFSQVYRGDSRTFVDAFSLCRTSTDRDRWVTQLNAYLYDEIGPQFWRSR
jgi:hypothetical protein